MLTYRLSLFEEFPLVFFLAFLLLFTLELELLDLLGGQLNLFSHTLIKEYQIKIEKKRVKGNWGRAFL